MLFLSAGHHPRAPGAAWKGFVEHDEAVLWVAELLKHLPGAVPVPTGELSQKIQFINSQVPQRRKQNLALEVHFNAASHVVSGCETLYTPNSGHGRALAVEVQAVLAQHFPTNRGVKPGWYQADPKKGPLAFLSRTTVPALIIEPEFIYWPSRIREQRGPCCAALANLLRRFV